LAVEKLRRFYEAFENQFAKPLPVLDHERNIASPDLQRGTTPLPSWTRQSEAKTRIEEASVVSPKLPSRRVIGAHFRCEVWGNAHALARKKKVELFRFKHETAGSLKRNGLPKVGPLVLPHLGQVEDTAVPTRLVADVIMFVGGEVKA
jgi:hypothetical protein